MDAMNNWALKFVRWGMGLSVVGLVTGYVPLGHLSVHPHEEDVVRCDGAIGRVRTRPFHSAEPAQALRAIPPR